MKRKFVFITVFAVAFAIVTFITSCDNLGTINGLVKMHYSIQVNNKQAGRAARNLNAEDTIELYINQLAYEEDANPRGLILIANGDRDQGSKGGILNNAGWYSVNAELAVTNDVNNGPYSTFLIGISKIRVNGTEYTFPLGQWGKIFGDPRYGGTAGYADNFNGITVKSTTKSIKTILTVEPEILGEPGADDNPADYYDSQGLAKDPYKYIKVEGRLNE